MERLPFNRVASDELSLGKVGSKRKATDAINTVGEKRLVSNNETQELLFEMTGYDFVRKDQLPSSSNGSLSDGRTSAETVESSATERDRQESYTTRRPTPLVLTNDSDSEAEFDFDSPEASFFQTPWSTFYNNLLEIGVPESDIDSDLFSTLKDMGFVLPSGESNEGVDLRDALSILKENSQTRQGRSGRGMRDTFTPTGSTSKTSGFVTNQDRKRTNKTVSKLTR